MYVCPDGLIKRNNVSGYCVSRAEGSLPRKKSSASRRERMESGWKQLELNVVISCKESSARAF